MRLPHDFGPRPELAATGTQGRVDVSQRFHLRRIWRFHGHPGHLWPGTRPSRRSSGSGWTFRSSTGLCSSSDPQSTPSISARSQEIRCRTGVRLTRQTSTGALAHPSLGRPPSDFRNVTAVLDGTMQKPSEAVLHPGNCMQ